MGLYDTITKQHDKLLDLLQEASSEFASHDGDLLVAPFD